MSRVLPLLALLGCAPELTAYERERLQALRMNSADRPEVPHPAEVELGHDLYFDCHFSSPLAEDSDLGLQGEVGRVSCATCHDPDHGGASHWSLPPGAGGPVGKHPPSVFNAGWRESVTWTARFDEMKDVLQVALTGNPHNLTIREIANYAQDNHSAKMQAAFGPPVEDPALAYDRVRAGLESFVRTLDTPNSKLDCYFDPGCDAEFDQQELLGAKLFVGKAACIDCHDGPIMSDGEVYELGVDDSGEHFQTPQLRNIALTPPYMHDGSMATLEDVLWFYNEGGTQWTEAKLAPLNLDETEIEALIAFLDTLTGELEQDVDEATCF